MNTSRIFVFSAGVVRAGVSARVSLVKTDRAESEAAQEAQPPRNRRLDNRQADMNRFISSVIVNSFFQIYSLFY